MTKRVHVYVSGQVQGVFYRAECRRRAQELGYPVLDLGSFLDRGDEQAVRQRILQP